METAIRNHNKFRIDEGLSEELKRSTVTEEVKQGFREKHAIPRAVRKTPADILVSHISMVYELVYPISAEIVWNQGYLKKMLEFESENEDTREWFTFMKIKFEEWMNQLPGCDQGDKS